MGDEEKFTPEELAILGEGPAVTPPAGPETPAPAVGGEPKPPVAEVKPEPKKEEEPKPEEPTPEEKQAAEAQGFKLVTEHGKTYFVDDDGAKIPVKRFKTVYREREEARRTVDETNRKYNLLKELGQERYYEIYPDEAPVGWKPTEKDDGKGKEPVAPPSAQNLGNMIVQGGPHNGKTLNEVWQEAPADAAFLQSQYLDSERQKVETEKQTTERFKKESVEEVDKFSVDLAKEMFGKEPDKLNPEEDREVAKTIKSIFDWMAKTNRGGAVLADAYFLMNKEKFLTDARTKGGKEALEGLKRPTPASVVAGGGASVGGFSAYEGMTADQLTAEVEKMSEKETLKFLKEAPSALRTKFPSLPWS